MEDKQRIGKQRTLDDFSNYVKANPDVSYPDAARSMCRSPRTIRRWCEKLGIKLAPALSGEQLPLSSPTVDGIKAATEAAIERVKGQTSSAEQRLAWEIASMNKVAEVQKNLAAAEAKTQFQPHSPVDDIGRMVTVVNAIKELAKEWASEWTAKTPAPNPGNLSYQACSFEEYEKMIDIEYKRSGKQARDAMLKDVIRPLKDYLFQRFGAGLPLQQTISRQQPIPTQPQQPIRPPQESSYESPKPQAPQPPQPQMVYVFRSPDQYEVTCPLCGTLVAVALDSISVNRCSGCGIMVLAVEDIPGNSEYIKQMKSNQWTEELTDKIQLAVQRFTEIAVKGLKLDTQPLVNKSKSTGDDALMGTFLAVAVREGIEKYLGGVSAGAVSSLVERNVGIEAIWEMIPQGFRQSMAVYSNEHPNQLRYVLDPTWVVEAIRDVNPSLAGYFVDHPSGKLWLDGIISGIGSKLGV